VKKILGKCSEMFGNVWKCLEMFGNVRKMFGQCLEKVQNWCGRSTNISTPGRPYQFRTFSEHVLTFSEHFRTFPNIGGVIHVRKCSEMFGNVRKMFGTGAAGVRKPRPQISGQPVGCQ
jgi:hypothetical protein